MPVWVAVLGAYIVGSLDFRRVLAFAPEASEQTDPPSLHEGSVRWMALLGGVLAGVLAAAAGWWAGEWGDPARSSAAFGAGAAATLGAVFPVLHRFHGRSAVPTAAGATTFLVPVAGLGGVAAGVIGWYLLRRRLPAVIGGSIVAGSLAIAGVASPAAVRGWAIPWLSTMLVLVWLGEFVELRRPSSPTQERESP